MMPTLIKKEIQTGDNVSKTIRERIHNVGGSVQL